MEARVPYGPWIERPRLVVVKDDGESARYSALPHAVLFDQRLTDGEVRMFAVLQSHWYGPSGECTASHETLAVETGKEKRTVRALLKSLEDKGVITSRHLGRGQAKAYRPAEPSSGQNLPVESGEYRPVTYPKRPKSASQAAENSQFKRPKSAASIEEDSGKKTLEEEGVPGVVPSGVADGAGRATATTSQADILKGLSPEAVEILAWWRQCHGKKRPPSLNPTQARLLEEAIVDLGVDRLKESVQYMAGKGVSEIDKARTAAYTKRQRDEDASEHAPSEPHVNGTAAVLTPATDDDRALWGRALDGLRPKMGAGNFEQCLAPLAVLGRADDGGLCLLAPAEIGDRLRGFRFHVIRALEDAGDQHPAAVKFKARKPKGQTDAE